MSPACSALQSDALWGTVAPASAMACPLLAGVESDWGRLRAPPGREELDQRDVWVSSFLHHPMGLVLGLSLHTHVTV